MYPSEHENNQLNCQATAPRAEHSGHKKHRGRKLAVICVALCVLLIGISTLAACTFYSEYLIDYIDELESEFETYDDSFDETTRSEETGDGGEAIGNDNMPIQATINKSLPQRVDADGDGRADIAYDQNGQVLTSAGNTTDTAATVVAKVADSVVEIFTETLVGSGWIGQYVTSGAGSGVIISPEGYIATNHHVIDGAGTIMVRLTDGTEYEATLISSDEQGDIAVLWIDAGDRELSVAKLGASYDLVVGEEILAIGNPMGSLGGTVTYGKISATAREITVDGIDMTLLQIDAPINPGNSGGALFNMAGRLVGIVNAKVSSSEIEGLAFAIPIDTAYDVIVDLISYGYVTGRPTMGLTLKNVQNPYTGESYVQISNSAYTDELKSGDRLVAIDGENVTTISDVTRLLTRYRAGDTVELTIYRSNRTLTVSLTLQEQKNGK